MTSGDWIALGALVVSIAAAIAAWRAVMAGAAATSAAERQAISDLLDEAHQLVLQLLNLPRDRQLLVIEQIQARLRAVLARAGNQRLTAVQRVVDQNPRELLPMWGKKQDEPTTALAELEAEIARIRRDPERAHR